YRVVSLAPPSGTAGGTVFFGAGAFHFRSLFLVVFWGTLGRTVLVTSTFLVTVGPGTGILCSRTSFSVTVGQGTGPETTRGPFIRRAPCARTVLPKAIATPVTMYRACFSFMRLQGQRKGAGRITGPHDLISTYWAKIKRRCRPSASTGAGTAPPCSARCRTSPPRAPSHSTRTGESGREGRSPQEHQPAPRAPGCTAPVRSGRTA